MFRYTLVLLTGLCLAGPGRAATWAESMFDELSKDFGSVPRGPTLIHPFHFRNLTGGEVHVAGVRVSCGCTTAYALKTNLAPGEEAAILAQMDTMRFSGTKTVTVYVQLDRPQWEEVRLWVHANARDDFALAPDTLALGKAQRGRSPSAAVTVTFQGRPQTQIIDVQPDSNYVQATLKEVTRQMTEATYQLSAKVRPETPVGKWYTDVWLKTNDPSMPRIRVPLTVEIDPSLSITPSTVALGALKVGDEAERRVIVRGVQPFRITAIKGADDQVLVHEADADSKQVHVLTVTFKAGKPGDLAHRIRIYTDLKEDNEIDFQARAQITP